MKGKVFVVVLLLGVLLLAGVACGGKEAPAMTAEDIRDRAIAAQAETNTGQFDADMTMHMRVVIGEEIIEATIEADSKGAFDQPNQKMYIDMDMLMEFTGEEAMVTSAEIYVVEDWMYVGTETPGEPVTWLKTPMTEEMWQQVDIEAQQLNILSDAEVQSVGNESVEGTQCYVLEVTPDMERFWSLMQSAGATEVLPPELEVEELITNFSVRSWIAHDTYFIVKTTASMSMVLTPESLGIPPEQAGDFEGTLDMAITFITRHINEPVTIELPPEAEAALEL